MTQFQRACDIRDVPEGEARMVLVGEKRVAVFHVDGQFFALDDHCPHAGASLGKGVVDGDFVACRIHHWRFRIRDGARVDDVNPCHNVPSYAVKLEDGQVMVAIS